MFERRGGRCGTRASLHLFEELGFLSRHFRAEHLEVNAGLASLGFRSLTITLLKFRQSAKRSSCLRNSQAGQALFFRRGSVELSGTWPTTRRFG